VKRLAPARPTDAANEGKTEGRNDHANHPPGWKGREAQAGEPQGEPAGSFPRPRSGKTKYNKQKKNKSMPTSHQRKNAAKLKKNKKPISKPAANPPQ
jgi:hypothetical protein